ncbi:MAG TPA: glutamate--tRNA ligase [Candidatus Babeliales bacterium]|nr:glutamate--tRNA ligase [Candidatus Babeliales bacterium]
MSISKVRTRFAPAPTGLMHLGSARTALMNYLFARQHNGVFILRIEDTDQQRNFDPGAKQIMADMAWLGLSYDEGPVKGGPYAPYFQSERTSIYEEYLQKLIDTDAVYRCFCTPEELEKKRQRQLALKLPPRYDRTCLHLSAETIANNLAKGMPFVWRLKLPQTGIVEINDLARGTVHFDFKNFSDQPLTRQDGSITFLFANFVDDLQMQITHVFRGEDHLTNTAVQTVMYKAFNAPLPIYWHMPILCNTEGKKLSKRDFGFSLNDLQQGGYLPEAINNYLAIIGGGTFEKEIMDLDELVKTTDFSQISTASQIRYDVEKLTWVNHKWIEQYNPEQLARRCAPFIEATFPETKNIDIQTLAPLIQTIKSDLTTIRDCQQVLHFYFMRPHIPGNELIQFIPQEAGAAIATVVMQHLASIAHIEQFMQQVKTAAKERNIPMKQLFAFIRLALMGQPEGPAIHDLISMLGIKEAAERLEMLCKQVG